MAILTGYLICMSIFYAQNKKYNQKNSKTYKMASNVKIAFKICQSKKNPFFCQSRHIEVNRGIFSWKIWKKNFWPFFSNLGINIVQPLYSNYNPIFEVLLRPQFSTNMVKIWPENHLLTQKSYKIKKFHTKLYCHA